MHPPSPFECANFNGIIQRKHYPNKAVKTLKQVSSVTAANSSADAMDRSPPPLVYLPQTLTSQPSDSTRPDWAGRQTGGGLLFTQKGGEGEARPGKDLLRFKWEQQSKQAVIAVQRQEV